MIHIYYDQDQHDVESITRACMERLVVELEQPEQIELMIEGGTGVKYFHLDDFEPSTFNCLTAEQMLTDKQVKYIIVTEPDTPDRYNYLGREFK